MLFGIVYTPRNSTGAAGSSLQPFSSWQPPVEFRERWTFAAGGGMGLVEADNSGVLERAIAPFRPFFDFRLECVDSNDKAVPIPLRTSTPVELVA